MIQSSAYGITKRREARAKAGDAAAASVILGRRGPMVTGAMLFAAGGARVALNPLLPAKGAAVAP
jgi:hypothetical protein